MRILAVLNGFFFLGGGLFALLFPEQFALDIGAAGRPAIRMYSRTTH